MSLLKKKIVFNKNLLNNNLNKIYLLIIIKMIQIKTLIKIKRVFPNHKNCNYHKKTLILTKIIIIIKSLIKTSNNNNLINPYH